jgi:preprotein translocase subunit SecY
MKYCPNPQCPYALRHHEGQEYRDYVAACTDCGAELVAERPIWPRPSVPNARGWAVWLRLALTLLAPPLVLWLHAALLVPRFNLSAFESTLGHSADSFPLVTVFGLGLWPVFIAFVVVEASALVWPGWRPFRNGGPAGRARLLRAAFKLGVGVASLQALTIALYLEQWGFLEPDARLSRVVVVLSMVAGVCIFVWFAQLLDWFALAGGFSVLALAFSLPSLDRWAESWRWLGTAEPLETTTTVAGILVAGVATFLALRRRLPGAQGNPSSVRLPACGVIPLRYGAGLRTIPTILAMASLGQVDARWLRVLLRPANVEANLVFRLFVTGVLAVGFGFLFNRPGRVAALEVKGPGISPQVPLKVAREQVARAIAWSTAYVLGVALLGGLLERASGVRGLDFVPVVMLVAVGLDVTAEVRARRRHGELVPVWPEHRLYAVDGALALLERAGIPCLARSVHHRALWHFLAPFIPIQIMVQPPRAEEANRLLHEHFGMAAIGNQNLSSVPGRSSTSG